MNQRFRGCIMFRPVERWLCSILFAFLKHGVVLPARGCGLFVQVLALDAALSVPLLLFNRLAAPPIATPTVAGAAYILLSSATEAVIQVAAAVASNSGKERHTVASFLRRVQRAVPRGAATITAGWVLRQACTAAVAAATFATLLLPLLPLGDVSFWVLLPLFLLGVLLMFLALGLHIYLGVVSAEAAVAAAAEPGRCGSAVARAWRLLRGRRSRAVVYVTATSAFWTVRLAAEWLMMPQAAGRSVVGAGVKHVLDHAVEVFSVAAATGLYFDCTKSKDEEDKAGHVD